MKLWNDITDLSCNQVHLINSYSFSFILRNWEYLEKFEDENSWSKYKKKPIPFPSAWASHVIYSYLYVLPMERCFAKNKRYNSNSRVSFWWYWPPDLWLWLFTLCVDDFDEISLSKKRDTIHTICKWVTIISLGNRKWVHLISGAVQSHSHFVNVLPSSPTYDFCELKRK